MWRRNFRYVVIISICLFHLLHSPVGIYRIEQLLVNSQKLRNTLLNTQLVQNIEHDIFTSNSFHKDVFFLKSTSKFSTTLKNHNNVKCEMYNFSIKTQHQQNMFIGNVIAQWQESVFNKKQRDYYSFFLGRITGINYSSGFLFGLSTDDETFCTWLLISKWTAQLLKLKKLLDDMF